MTQPQHVWVDETNHWAGEQRPGVLLEWRQSERRAGTWEGLCVWAADHQGQWQVRQKWLPAEQVRAVGGQQ